MKFGRCMKGLCGCVGNVGGTVDVWVWWAVHWMHGCHGLLTSLGSWSWQVTRVGSTAAATPSLSRGSDVFWHLLWMKNSQRRSKQSCIQMLGVLEGGAVTRGSVAEGLPSWPLLLCLEGMLFPTRCVCSIDMRIVEGEEGACLCP